MLWGGALCSFSLACIILNPPIVTHLFAEDAKELAPAIISLFDRIRLAAGVLGLLFLAFAVSSRTAGRRLPVKRGLVFVVIASTIIFAILGEVFLRIQGAREWGSFFRTPLSVGSMHKKGEQPLRPGSYVNRVVNDLRPDAETQTIQISIQPFGVRGPAPREPGPGKVPRIVCLGGSTTFGYSVSDGAPWPRVLEKQLKEVGPVEVVNAGRPGATTWRNFQYLRDRMLTLEPDIVLFYEGFNDMWRGVRRHASIQDDYGVAEVDVPATPYPFIVGPTRAWPLRLSFLAYRIGLALHRYREEPPILTPPAEKLYHPSIVNIYEKNLSAMIRLTRKNGAIPVVMTFASCDSTEHDKETSRRCLKYVTKEIPPLDADLARIGMTLYRQKTKSAADKERAILIDLASLLPRDPDLFADTVHFSVEGERRVATILSRYMIENSLLSSRLGFH